MNPFKRRDSADQLRILVTGSRRWTDRLVIRHALEREFECVAGYVEPTEIVVIHGAQGVYEDGYLTMGADMIADEQAKVLGMRTEPYPADWEGPCDESCHHGSRRRRGLRGYCQLAGFRRNQAMVDTRPDLCLGFPLGPSPGTRDCLRRCKAAGIPVYDVPSLLKQGLVLL